jgi:hypothetical protein
MTISELGAIGEFVGSMLTLVTLVYLAVQIRQNTAQQQREENISVQHGQNSVVRELQDPRVMGAYVRYATDQQPSVEDRGTAFSWIVQYLNHFGLVHELYRNGGMNEERYQLWAGFAVAIVAPPGVRRWWDEENGRMGFHREVRELIDRALQDPDNPPEPITEMWSMFNGEAWAAARVPAQN